MFSWVLLYMNLNTFQERHRDIDWKQIIAYINSNIELNHSFYSHIFIFSKSLVHTDPSLNLNATLQVSHKLTMLLPIIFLRRTNMLFLLTWDTYSVSRVIEWLKQLSKKTWVTTPHKCLLGAVKFMQKQL